jgi:UDP-N-acetylglucosamine 2-epimerase
MRINMKPTIINDTSQEIIRRSPIVRECEQLDPDFVLLRIGQHYSYDIDQVFLNHLELSGPNYDLKVRSISNTSSHEKILTSEN